MHACMYACMCFKGQAPAASRGPRMQPHRCEHDRPPALAGMHACMRFQCVRTRVTEHYRPQAHVNQRLRLHRRPLHVEGQEAFEGCRRVGGGAAGSVVEAFANALLKEGFAGGVWKRHCVWKRDLSRG